MLIGGALMMTAAGCAPPGPPPGMALQSRRPHALDTSLDELARVEPAPDQRALLVVFPKTACSASARTLFMDGNGTFYGGVGPGEAALLSVPANVKRLYVMSSIEVTADVGAWSYFDEVTIPPAPSGILLSSGRYNARTCGNGHYGDPSIATKDELEEALAEAEFQWLEPRRSEGQRWIEAHRTRVDEVLGRNAPPRGAVVTRYVVR